MEVGYKREKCRLEIENFSGLSAHAVKQDFYAKLFVLNTATAHRVSARDGDSLEAVRPDRSYPRKIKPAKLHAFHPSLPSQLRVLP